MALSIETTTGVEDERKRIEDGEGRIDGSGNVWYGPVGIAMTRALGDSVMTRAGVISTPQVKTLDLMQEVTCRNIFKIRDCNIRVLIGSDGIFDVMSNVEANEFLCNLLKATSVSLTEMAKWFAPRCTNR
jgi:serine/threonine protein phosphatase PrpC